MGKIYRKAIKVPFVRRSRRLPIFGKGDDRDRYFRCWHCGFICDTKRDELGGKSSNAGDEHTDYTSLANAESYHVNAGNKACLGGDIGHYHVAMEIGADSEPKTVRHDLTTDVSRGCPFCGSVNYRGDY